MKQTILAISTLAFLLAPLPQAQANHDDGVSAGAFIAGAVGIVLLADALSDDHRGSYRHHRERNCYQAPVYCAPVRNCEPAPYCPPRNYWIPGYYTTCTEQVWVPGSTTRVWVEPQYQYEWQCGHRVSILVCEGHYECQNIPGHYEQQTTRRWVSGQWSNC